jgi:hypothetical protein
MTMSNFDFTSQICTTKEQSERLLALGLKKETADMRYQTHYLDLGGILKECTPSLEPYPPLNNDRFIPAWSLHRLIEIYEKTCTFWTDCGDNPYEAMISRIANEIKWGELNKEYLEE